MLRWAEAVHPCNIGCISVNFGPLHLLIVDIDCTTPMTPLTLARALSFLVLERALSMDRRQERVGIIIAKVNVIVIVLLLSGLFTSLLGSALIRLAI